MYYKLSERKSVNELKEYMLSNKNKKIFIVSYDYKEEPKIITILKKMNYEIIFFKDFEPNPTYEQVLKGIECFKKSKCKMIMAIGGGSCIDVAKCIKAFSSMDDSINYLDQQIKDNRIILMSVPTTAGTGSEATKYTVIYYNGVKQSITHDSLIPKIVIFDKNILKSLPIYTKKATVLDAFSHSIESYWSVNSTEESKKYSKKALKLIINNFDKYLVNDEKTYLKMLEASNLAGKAINITQTTAGHAMCYKLTSLYNIPHGHAACLINSELLPFMIDNLDKCIDKRGKKYLEKTFKEISKILGCNGNNELKEYIRNLLRKLDLYNVSYNLEDINLLKESVNPTRLKNNPIELDKQNIEMIYRRLFSEIERMK